jgi:peptidoglycan/LPS O-acetylase OafA/YrhL
VLATLYALSVVYSEAMQLLYKQSGGGSLYQQLQWQLPGQLGFFIAGMAGYYYRDAFKKHGCKLLPLAILGIIFFSSPDFNFTSLQSAVISPISLGIIVIFAAICLPSLGNFSRYGDFSYGIYILHYPLINTLVALGFYRDPFTGLGLTLVLAFLLAFSLWHGVEKRFLRPSSHYMLASHAH